MRIRRLVSGLLTVLVLLTLLPVGAGAEEQALLGDADGDGNIFAVDASVVLRHLVAITPITDEQLKKNADADGDGEITALDAAAILRYVVGLDTLPPSNPTVTPAPTTPAPIGVTFESLSVSVAVGNSVALKYSSNTSTVPTVTFTSLNPAVATVDASGVVTGISEGTTKILADVAGGSDHEITVTVENISTSIRLTDHNLPLAGQKFNYGQSFTLEGRITSDSAISSVVCQIYDLYTNSSIAISTYAPSGTGSQKTFRLQSGIDLDFAQLSCGAKKLVVLCTNATETVTLYSNYFIITDSSQGTAQLIASTYNDSAYYQLYSSNMSWAQASNFARQNGGTLAVVGTSTENALIRRLLPSSGNYWLGASSNASGAWTWERTNEPFIYSNLGNAQLYPSMYLAIDSSGTWTAHSNSSSVGGFVVEAPFSSLNVVATKLQYESGESFDKNSLSVYLTYSNGAAIEITDYTLSDTTLPLSGYKTIKVSYGAHSTLLTLSVGDVEEVPEGTWFEECEQQPLMQDYERLEYGEKVDLHGTVHSDGYLTSVTVTIVNESTYRSYVTTRNFAVSDMVTTFDFTNPLDGEDTVFVDSLPFANLPTGYYNFTISASSTNNIIKTELASGTFRIARSSGLLQLTSRKFSHNYYATLEFFDYDTEQFLFQYSWGEGRHINIDSAWKSKYLTTITGYNGKTWQIHVKSVPNYQTALNYLNTTYVRVRGTNGDSGVILLGSLINEQSGPQVSRFQSNRRLVSHHALGTAIDINPSMKPNGNDIDNKSLILFEVGSCLQYNGIMSNGIRSYYDFTYIGSYNSRYKSVPLSVINYLIYELSFFRAGFKWGCYYTHTSDAMHYTLTEMDIENHEPENGGLRKVYSYIG
ncbi:MAG: dockerin type I domain-containing protein [Clostridia bacterium]|nr:dockerin type I domain-containing protein [Clostridia bacterium]